MAIALCDSGPLMRPPIQEISPEVSQLALTRMLPEVGTIYEHFRGGTYIIRGIALDSETKSPMVVYQSVSRKISDDGLGEYEINTREPWWVRSLDAFFQEIPTLGVKRFRLLPPIAIKE